MSEDAEPARAVTVAVTPRSFRRTPGAHLELLENSQLQVRYPSLDRHLDEDEMIELVRGCTGLLVGVDPVTEPVLRAGPLRAVIKYGAGTDNIDLDAAERHDVAVHDTRGENATSVAELAVGLLLALARNITEHDRRTRQGSWDRRTGTELAGKRLGLVGYGAVGREVRRIAEGLGMEVVVHDPYIHDVDVPTLPLPELLAGSDAVSLHAPLNDETRGLIDAESLSKMRPTAFLVNTARGGLVDEHALADALRDERLAGAAFDSFSTEPPTDSPLLGSDRFVASPHAGAATQDAVIRTGTAAVRLLLDALGRTP